VGRAQAWLANPAVRVAVSSVAPPLASVLNPPAVAVTAVAVSSVAQAQAWVLPVLATQQRLVQAQAQG
jgi:hypothetical protein